MTTNDFSCARSSDGTAIAYRLVGDPSLPCLVLSNGVGCSDEYWEESFVPTCLPWARVLLWNYRGHYASQPATDPARYRIEDHADDLLAVLDAAGVDEAVLVAFSMGVQVTLEAYRRAPERVLALALLSGSCERPLDSFGGSPVFAGPLRTLFRFAGRHPRLTQLGLRGTMGNPLALRFAQLSRFCEPDVPRHAATRFLQRACREMDPTAYMQSLHLMGEHSAREVLPTVAVPTLIVAGTEDTMTPVAKMEQMRDRIPGAEFCLAEGGRHTLLMSRGAWIADELRAFLDRVGLAAR